MQKTYEWRSYRTAPDAGNSIEVIEDMERLLGISFPAALKQGYLVSDTASIFKEGKECCVAVTGPKSSGGNEVGFFQNIERLNRIPQATRGLQDWVANAFELDIPGVFPFAEHFSGGWVCLNYQADPTQSKPEIWQLDVNGTSFEDCFTKVADSFDDLIDMLVTEDELAKLGFS